MLNMNMYLTNENTDPYIRQEGYRLMQDIAKAIKESIDGQKEECKLTPKKKKNITSKKSK